MKRARPTFQLHMRGLVLLLLAACASKPSEKPAAAAAADATPAADAAPAAAAAPDAAPAPTKAQLADYRRHLARGRKLAATSKWGEAVTEFEAALVAIPHDGRALSELGWAAFNAGDHATARQASGESVLLALDPKLKAASLYNLGRVEEAAGAHDTAAGLYRQSLALRPSKTVEARLAGLSKDASGDDPFAEDSFCTEPMPLAELCACVDSHASYWDKLSEAGERSCTVAPAGKIAGVRLIDATISEDSGTHLLAAEGPGGWTVVATIGDVFNPGAMGVYEEWELVSMKEETVGGRRVLRITSAHHRHDSDTGIYEEESLDTTVLTVCVLGDVKTATRCPLQVPVVQSYVRERMEIEGELSDEEKEFLARDGTPGLPIKRRTELRVDVKADGTAEVVLVKGSGEYLQGVVGPKKLW